MVRRPKPTNRTTEWWVKAQVKLILKDTGWTFWMPNADVFGRSGVSDFLAIKRPALFMAIETKYDDVVTTLQFKFLTDVHEAGHYAFVVDETNIETLRKLLTDEIAIDELRNLLVSEDAAEFKSLLKWQENLTTNR